MANPQANHQPPPGNSRGHISRYPGLIATRYGDWVRAILILLAWSILLITALGAAYLAIRGLLFVLDLAHRALGI